MIVALYGLLSLYISFLGVKRSLFHKSLIIYIWSIVLYYSMTSIISIGSPDNIYISETLKIKYMQNQFFCIFSFYICDLVFNRKIHNKIDFDYIKSERFFFYMEIIYWISFILTFVHLRKLDYASYNTSNGGGWAQIFFMLFSGVVFNFVLMKKWLKLCISMILMLLIIVATDVRSLLYFIIMPVFFFVLYRILFTVTNLKLFIRKSMPFAILLFFFSFIVSYIRFGYYSLPETELTSIALDSMDRWKFEFQYFNSILKYFSGFLGVFRNSLSILDINLPDYMRFIPSVPQLNAMIQAQVLDVTDLENAYHMPATIFYDFMMCWDMFAPVAAFFTYWYFIKVFDIFQKTSFRIILFSSIVGWHFYMLMRGAVDTCSSAMAYPFILGILIYYLVIKFSLIKENQEIS